MLSDQINIPRKITKQLKFNTTSSGQRIVISSNFLQGLGWEVDDRIKASLNSDGIKIVKCSDGENKIHQRTYRLRSNNPHETVIQLSSQSMIKRFKGATSDKFHVTMSRDIIQLKSLPNRTASIIDKFKRSRKMTSMVCMSGGVDASNLERNGFEISCLLEHRPQESRDKTDKTEVTSIMASALSSPKILINESIYDYDMSNLESIFSDDPLMFMHLSPVCKSFSLAASPKDKQRKIESGESTLDMIVPIIDSIKIGQPTCVLVENVVPFSQSQACEILELQLNRMGYFVTKFIHNPIEHDGISTRQRCYIFASVFPDYTQPIATENSKSIWDIINKHIDDCIDVTEAKSVINGALSGRERVIKEGDKYSKTILASQSRGTKDALRILKSGRYYKPSLKLCAEIMGLRDFPTDLVSLESAFEVIGNGVDIPSHEAIIESIVEHLKLNAGNKPLIKLAKQVA
ncbi:DNA cytosine methyltransferase [Pseudoalteromonas luteoviolacea]|uniref:Uncharacterized protein n=1 Tax=Pseudoalteromonas luteoviolacea S4060-1 TaxID=1365257 RepID=A0A167KV32_9GAMM|nr:DNA cytosine methyltransferase [Pseudoalteromonas luteoviolacea]KZN63325.1 hypothetical protein N478_03485 [Pseudoalteromonas luteoviolacea S4060-1]